ncbi:purine-binding chemotaxis protein CheW [Inhella inkyongensis]|uniref:Chemotaxis protein CheW n=1 Tax=Inhella inkyongensis TaxID=392593 RepID=A0A840S468_9BURK|nr:chemotaxis protein CheW [Inhella inkyongensis]MBB5204513.1 purine-binding chemotaxis protein CheW [Inhella inkyongensis]
MSSTDLVVSSQTGASSTGSKPSKQFLTFRIGAEEYGIDILKVQEIRSYEAPTRIAHAPSFVKGVVNLRGVIVPIMDMRLRLGCDAQYSGFTVVIVLNIGNRVLGMVVDSVSDVLELTADQIRPAPEMAAAIDSRFVTGLGKIGERILILLDIEGMVASPEFGLTE